MPRSKDRLFRDPYPPTRFEFNEPVARVFEDMLARSVPYYRECLDLTVEIVRRFAAPGTRVVDLGCSTGTLLKRLAEVLPPSVRLVGLDNSPAMLNKARRRLAPYRKRCDLVEADLNTPPAMPPARVMVLNYTLQFIPPRRRGAVLRGVFRGLAAGGALVLIEKVRAGHPALEALFQEEHHRFKRKRGYSRLEIARKRQALEKVLEPLSAAENERLLRRAGFRPVEPFFRWCNFAGWVALKPPSQSGKS